MTIACIVFSPQAKADDLGCHLADATSGPPRQILVCDAGPTIETEQGGDINVIDRAGTGKPDAVRVNAGGVLIDVPGHYPGGFQVLTPRAVASVRGTNWVVDVKPDETAVFVIRGRVLVRRSGGGSGVLLKAGDGVDVGDGQGPLRVKRWSSRRVAALLDRFGR